MTCTNTTTLGVYLLGALEPHERSDFESHLAGCDICRAELVRLAPLPGLLHQISPDDFEDGLPPAPAEPLPPLPGPAPLPGPQLVTEPVPVADVVPLPPEPARRPRRYWQVAAAAVLVVLLVAAGVFGWRALRHDDTPPAAAGVTWTASERTTGVEGAARLIDREWGTEIQVKVHGTPPGQRCYLIVYDHYGKSEVTGWWWTDHDPNEEIPASTSIRRSKIERIEFKLEDEHGQRTLALTIPEPEDR